MGDPKVVEARYLVPLLPKNNVFLYPKQTVLLFLSNTAQTSLLKSAALAPSRSASMSHLLNLKENAELSPKPTANQGKLRSVSHLPKTSVGQSQKVSVSGSQRHPAPQPPRSWMCTLVSSKQLDLLTMSSDLHMALDCPRICMDNLLPDLLNHKLSTIYHICISIIT